LLRLARHRQDHQSKQRQTNDQAQCQAVTN